VFSFLNSITQFTANPPNPRNIHRIAENSNPSNPPDNPSGRVQSIRLPDMAWRSSGNNNVELTRNLVKNGLIHSKSIEKAFLTCDRRLFLPRIIGREHANNVHIDMPIKIDYIHTSAPHMYAHILESLDLWPGQSFLNCGSGSGWLQNMIASILGSTGITYGIEINRQAMIHSRRATKFLFRLLKQPYYSDRLYSEIQSHEAQEAIHDDKKIQRAILERRSDRRAMLMLNRLADLPHAMFRLAEGGEGNEEGRVVELPVQALFALFGGGFAGEETSDEDADDEIIATEEPTEQVTTSPSIQSMNNANIATATVHNREPSESLVSMDESDDNISSASDTKADDSEILFDIAENSRPVSDEEWAELVRSNLEIDPEVRPRANSITSPNQTRPVISYRPPEKIPQLAQSVFICGDVFELDAGNPLNRFDRIYVGACARAKDKQFFRQFLNPGGRLLGTFDDELVCIRRVGTALEYTERVISEVGFANLQIPEHKEHKQLAFPSIPWTEYTSNAFPKSFQRVVDILLMAQRRETGVFSSLPLSILMQIYSYFHREDFNTDDPLNKPWIRSPQEVLNQFEVDLRKAQRFLRENKFDSAAEAFSYVLASQNNVQIEIETESKAQQEQLNKEFDKLLVQAQNGLAESKLQLNDNRSAIQAAKKSLLIDSKENAEALWVLARAYSSTKQYNLANKNLAYLLEFNPNHSEAKELSKLIREKQEENEDMASD
jgi:protein-L-isoaspartate O-methyltransferase